MESASTSGTEAPMPAHIPAAIDTVAPKWRPSGSDMYNWSGCLTRHIEAQSCAPTKEEAGAMAAETQYTDRYLIGSSTICNVNGWNVAK